MILHISLTYLRVSILHDEAKHQQDFGLSCDPPPIREQKHYQSSNEMGGDVFKRPSYFAPFNMLLSSTVIPLNIFI